MVRAVWYAIAGASAIAIRWSIDHALDPRPISLAELIVLDVLAFVLGHAVWFAVETQSAGESNRRWAAGWLVAVVGALAVWPYAIRPSVYPPAALLLFFVLAGFPLALADSLTEQTSSRAATLYRRTLVAALTALVGVSSASYLIAIRPVIGSVDFFYYVCYARDMVNGWDSPSAYAYFPGVYAFWRAVLRTTGGSLASLQTAYLLVILANALLVSAVVYRLSRSFLAVLVGLPWYLVLASRYQGFAGVTEPLATMPFLVAILVWGGRPLRSRRQWATAALMGACLGLTAYTKQQAGMLALGALAIVVTRPLIPADQRTRWSHLSLLPAVAAAVFLLGILAEGHGLAPLIRGISRAATLEPAGSMIHNLYVQVRADEIAALAALAVTAVWLTVVLGRKKHASLIGCPWFQVFGFLVAAGLASIPQFARFPHGHYMLLPAPALVIAGVLAGGEAGRRLVARFPTLELPRLAFVFLALLPLVGNAYPHTLLVWRPIQHDPRQIQRLWHQDPAVQSDVDSLRAVIKPGQTMYVLPPRHSSLYFLLGTRSAHTRGYSFLMPDFDEIPWDACDWVVLLKSSLEASDRRIWNRRLAAEVRQRIAGRGFHLRDDLELSALEVYERVPAASEGR